MKSSLCLVAGVAFVALIALPANAADISVGIPYAKGAAAGVAYKDEVNGIKLKLVQLDDATDPSNATRDARKLIEEDKVDVLMGSGSTPSSIAITAVCHELKVPCITISPVKHAGRTRLVDDLNPAAAKPDGVGSG